MGRAERRREQKQEQKSKTVTYNLTKEQLDVTLADNCISVMAHFSNTTNVVTNNDACGVSGQFTVYFN